MLNLHNPFTPNDPHILELYQKRDLIKKDIERIQEELKRKTDMFLEVQNNHIASYEQMIQELKDKCTHKYPNGEYACGKTHRDRIDYQDDGTFKRVSYCELCGSKFDYGDGIEDMDEFGEVIEFDPNWQPGSDVQFINPRSVIAEIRRRNIPVVDENDEEVDLDDLTDADFNGFDLDELFN